MAMYAFLADEIVNDGRQVKSDPQMDELLKEMQRHGEWIIVIAGVFKNRRFWGFRWQPAYTIYRHLKDSAWLTIGLYDDRAAVMGWMQGYLHAKNEVIQHANH